MKDVYFAEYHIKANEDIQANSDHFLIIQTMCETGHFTIGENTYPVSKGALYFIDGAEEYHLNSVMESACLNSVLAISKRFLFDLSKLLSFQKEVDDIFSDGGYSVALPHYKTVDNRFRRMVGSVKSYTHYSKALFTSDLIALLNYAVYNLSK